MAQIKQTFCAQTNFRCFLAQNPVLKSEPCLWSCIPFPLNMWKSFLSKAGPVWAIPGKCIWPPPRGTEIHCALRCCRDGIWSGWSTSHPACSPSRCTGTKGCAVWDEMWPGCSARSPDTPGSVGSHKIIEISWSSLLTGDYIRSGESPQDNLDLEVIPPDKICVDVLFLQSCWGSSLVYKLQYKWCLSETKTVCKEGLW